MSRKRSRTGGPGPALGAFLFFLILFPVGVSPAGIGPRAPAFLHIIATDGCFYGDG